jgi:hypothetical protein
VFYQFHLETDKGEKSFNSAGLSEAGERQKNFFPNECNNPKSKLLKKSFRLLDG